MRTPLKTSEMCINCDDQRAQLVDDLIATLKPEIAAPLDDAWLAEGERRTQGFDAGDVEAFTWAEVKQ